MPEVIRRIEAAHSRGIDVAASGGSEPNLCECHQQIRGRLVLCYFLHLRSTLSRHHRFEFIGRLSALDQAVFQFLHVDLKKKLCFV